MTDIHIYTNRSYNHYGSTLCGLSGLIFNPIAKQSYKQPLENERAKITDMHGTTSYKTATCQQCLKLEHIKHKKIVTSIEKRFKSQTVVRYLRTARLEDGSKSFFTYDSSLELVTNDNLLQYPAKENEINKLVREGKITLVSHYKGIDKDDNTL